MSGSAVEFIPHNYQDRSIDDLVYDPFHGLFEDPGLGKTVCALEAFRQLRELLVVERMLIVAPLRVCYSVWPRELAKWSQFRDLRIVNLHAGERHAADIFVCNPEHLIKVFGRRDPDNPRKWIPGYWRDWKRRPEMLVIDESSVFKRASGVRFKTLGRYFGDFARRVILTGSPAPNGYEDLHGQIKILDGGRSLEEGAVLDPRVTYYRKRYFVPIPTGRAAHDVTWKLRPGSAEEILEAIAPRVTCLRAEDWLDMPEKIVIDVPVDLPDRARRAYRDMLEEALCDLPDGSTLLAAPEAAQGKLRQIVNGFVYDEGGRAHHIHDAKRDALTTLLDEIGDHPTIIAYEFKADYAVIRKALGRPTPHLGSGVSGKEGDKVERDWNAGKIGRLLVQPQSMSFGLNLQEGGSRLVWYAPTWNLEHYNQLIARLYRQGQVSDRVMIYFLVGRGTVDEKVARVLRKKDATEADLKAALAEETEWES